jgi:surface protein
MIFCTNTNVTDTVPLKPKGCNGHRHVCITRTVFIAVYSAAAAAAVFTVMIVSKNETQSLPTHHILVPISSSTQLKPFPEPALTPLTKPAQKSIKCFDSNEELYETVREYMVDVTGVIEIYGDISDWCVDAVTSFKDLFFDDRSETNPSLFEKFDEDISKWNTSNVVYMQNMFNGASSFDQDISQWDTSKVTNMSYMFHDASTFNQFISQWDVRQVTDISSMFVNAVSYDQDLCQWRSMLPWNANVDNSYTSNANYTVFEGSSCQYWSNPIQNNLEWIGPFCFKCTT